MANTGNLYSKSILVRLTNSKSEDRFKSIHITVDYQTSSVPTLKTELIIKLTDELDPFFLYSLYMSEEDYQTLKVQQGLLVDFSAFGQRFIDLLCACEKDEKSDNPKFQLQFYSKEPLPYDHGHASLNVIEINPFKHLCHLSLNFMPGNDADVKKYLATCLKTLREDFSKLSRVYEETKSSLSQKLESTQQMLSHKNVEIDKLKVELESHAEKLMTKHMQEMNFERDKSLQTQYATQQKFEKEKKDLELSLMKSIKQLEQRQIELEAQNKELLEKKYKNESQLQEFRLKNTTLQEEFNVVKAELSNIRKQNSTLDSELHSNEKQANQLRTRIAVLEQELKDKVDNLTKAQEMLGNEQSQRKQLDDMIKEKSNELKKKQSEINHYIQEFKKGNDVVIKLQNREKTLVGQIKLKTRILTEQEKVMKEKEKEIDDLKSEVKELKMQTSNLGDENKDLKNSLQKKTLELDEAAKLLKRDENIISWLNKQITDNNLASSSSTNKMINSYESQNGNVAFKPIGTLISNTNGSTGPMGIDSTLGMGMMRMNSTANSSGNTYLNKSTSNDLLDTNRRLLALQNQQQPLNQLQIFNSNTYQQRSAALSSSSSSSVQHANEMLKENQEIDSPTLSQRLNGSNGELNNNGSKTANSSGSNSTRLDPKYFQSNSPNLNNNMDIVSIRPQAMRQTLTTTTNTNRIPKHLVQPTPLASTSNVNTQQQQPLTLANQGAQYTGISNGAISSKSTPSLASAYFPTN